MFGVRRLLLGRLVLLATVSYSASGSQGSQQFAHLPHTGLAAIIPRVRRRELDRKRNDLFSYRLEVRIINANGGKSIPVPLVPGTIHETFYGIGHFFCCPLHSWNLIPFLRSLQPDLLTAHYRLSRRKRKSARGTDNSLKGIH